MKFYTEKKQDSEVIRRFNQVYLARTDQRIQSNLEELSGVEWFTRQQLENHLATQPDDFSSSLKHHFKALMKQPERNTSE